MVQVAALYRNRTTNPLRSRSLVVVLSAEAGLAVGDLDVELLGAGDDGLALLGRNVAADLGGVLGVVHEEELEVLDIRDAELVEATREHAAGALVGTISEGGEEPREGRM